MDLNDLISKREFLDDAYGGISTAIYNLNVDNTDHTKEMKSLEKIEKKLLSDIKKLSKNIQKICTHESTLSDAHDDSEICAICEKTLVDRYGNDVI